MSLCLFCDIGGYKMAVKKGDKIKVEYTGSLEDGTVFDSSEKQGKPLEFEVGSGQIIKGFDEALIGMEKGQEKEIKIEPADAYGQHNPQLIKKLPKDKFPTDKEIKPNMMLVLGTPDGRQIPTKVMDVTDSEITLDLNHPLAGKTLTFKIKVVEVSS